MLHIRLTPLCRLMAILLSAGLALATSGCREEEQLRMIKIEKGTYAGPADEALSPETVDALRQRSAQQRFQ